MNRTPLEHVTFIVECLTETLDPGNAGRSLTAKDCSTLVRHINDFWEQTNVHPNTPRPKGKIEKETLSETTLVNVCRFAGKYEGKDKTALTPVNQPNESTLLKIVSFLRQEIVRHSDDIYKDTLPDNRLPEEARRLLLKYQNNKNAFL